MGPVSRFAPPLAVMALIFALSATPDLSSGLGAWDTVLRKLAHVTVFGVLWLTLARSTRWRRPGFAAVLAILYATSDEFHQTFVEGRHGTPVDVAIDGVGIGLAALAWTVTSRRARLPRASGTGPPRALEGAGGEPRGPLP